MLRNRKNSEQPILDRARNYCAQAEQCESGVRQKLVSWGATPSETEEVIGRLRDEGYIDDARYARVYCESKILHQHWGRQKVLYQLRAKRLPKEAINDALAAIDDETYNTIIQAEADKKMRTLGELEHEAARLRLFSFLASRGFTPSEVNEALKPV